MLDMRFLLPKVVKHGLTKVGVSPGVKLTWDYVIPCQHVDRRLRGIYSIETPSYWVG